MEEQDDELEELFDSVVEEIEERQMYLEKVTDCGGNKEIEARVKNEIVGRIGELQKIRELQNKGLK
jgi:transcription antitermination factor NusA-like protein